VLPADLVTALKPPPVGILIVVRHVRMTKLVPVFRAWCAVIVKVFLCALNPVVETFSLKLIKL
jgi:hypothetical protein